MMGVIRATEPYAQEKMERLERKLIIPQYSTDSMLAWMRHALIPNPVYHYGVIHSIYYDTPEMDSYYECLNGDIYKNKVRLRWYERPNLRNEPVAYVEVKSKSGFYTIKHRQPIKVSEPLLITGKADEIISPIALQKVLLALGYMPRKQLNPRIMITYNRYRFQVSSSVVSISLDTDIRSQMVERTGAIYPDKLYLPSNVIEIKGGTMELPPKLSHMINIRAIWSSFSKYARCIESHFEKPDSVGRLLP